MKLAAPMFVCLLGFAAAGCQNDRPKPYTPEHALDVYRGRLASTCAEKHMEHLPAEEFNRFGREFYVDADTQTQQLIDLDTRKSCGANTSGDCYKTGFVQAAIQIGNLNEVTKHICSLPVACSEQGQCTSGKER